MNENILEELKRPFHPSDITWKPQAITKDQTKAMACAYGDLRAYQNRLDEVCGMNWSVTYTPWGETKVVCHLTINGVTRSSTGESDSQSERSEIGGTAAEAQAFKRAAAMFGLGRYLYELPSVWVEYDANSKQFTDKAKAKLEGIIVQHYQRYLANNKNAPQQNASPTPSNKASEAPELVIPATFANGDAATKWGYDTGAFDAYQHAQNAYNKLKEEKKPKAAADMFKAWTDDVQKRLAEKKTA